MSAGMSGVAGIDRSLVQRHQQLVLGLWAFLATVTMLFAAFTSAYLVRGGAPDWEMVRLPSLLWLNTGVLVLSSVALEIGRAQARRELWGDARGWLLAAAVLGVVFLVGQVAAWNRLSEAGFALSSTPHVSFFYILTAVHGAHLLAGLVTLTVTWARIRAAVDSKRAFRQRGLMQLAATFWHFLGIVWIYVFGVLSTL